MERQFKTLDDFQELILFIHMTMVGNMNGMPKMITQLIIGFMGEWLLVVGLKTKKLIL